MKKFLTICAALFVLYNNVSGQEMDEMWDNRSNNKANKNVQWFKDAKFGMFIHWGLYSKLAGEWNGKRYYGSGEWIMNQAKIPVAEYEKVAKSFNPIKFDAEEWAQIAEDAGMKYMVVTAKHHEGFSMFDSKYTNFDIVDATPYKKDPMKSLAKSVAKRNIHFGFYYSQFQDWYEPNGGRNTWDFKEAEKDYQKYYKEKAIPQLKELMTNYGKLGTIWFDTPGGLTKQETEDFVNSLRKYQPECLFSSRVGHGLGDYRDFGDSELPPFTINGPWESIYTHNDSWGYIKHDLNFKTPKEIIYLLANAAARGGNLMLNVGPDGEGSFPAYSIQYLREVGNWLKINGESIYASTAGLLGQQPWGVSTSKPGKQYLHILNRPVDGEVLIPDFDVTIKKVYLLDGGKELDFEKRGKDIILNLPLGEMKKSLNEVVVLEYSGQVKASQTYNVVSDNFQEIEIPAYFAKVKGNANLKSLTYSHYYGDWKHTNCVVDAKNSGDEISFDIRVTKPGTYKIKLEYNCGTESALQEGVLTLNNTDFLFRTLKTGEFDRRAPLPLIQHSVATTTFDKEGLYKLNIRPLKDGKELFKLKSLIFEAVR
ncbi:glycoside hydrolase family 29 (alpha-L-fucosidase) [Pseudopedobacter saltans DSM 12145]|uniref:alpha-L-fucosidase n=1 Tax=Pseudopedobacter saltans (strain ATCC 51119 / DSM 12145 / JCM 21818 / CCUG 39354 / LMG 10337 / NBRC 100064 / NCIMB 13643) TaxID=762903 RepID=F0SAI4_PSESL|nr:alpha-L-fucosidase [Pseudopedobacter saltans]ADY52604.1 glycoside hydrolase family 29 (alpha-L-fucosidase) [Pseudopedobacter saltans DSM 12145]